MPKRAFRFGKFRSAVAQRARPEVYALKLCVADFSTFRPTLQFV